MAKALVAIDEQQARQYPPASRRRGRSARLAARGLARARRSALSRSLAEAAPLETALRQRCEASRGWPASCAPGGEFRFATDWANYAEWTLLRLLRVARFAWTAERADDWRKPWAGFGGTRYEAKASARGPRADCYLMFRRN